MKSLLVFEEVVFSVESSLVTLARQDWAKISFRTMDFTFVALEAAFVSETFAVARYVLHIERETPPCYRSVILEAF